MRLTGSGTQSVGTAFRRLTPSRERPVECLVVEDHYLRGLHPVFAELTVVEDYCADKFAPHPFGDVWMFPELGAEGVLEVERNTLPCQFAHDCVHAAEELVGRGNPRFIPAFDARESPNILGIESSQWWRTAVVAPCRREGAAWKSEPNSDAVWVRDKIHDFFVDLFVEKVLAATFLAEVELEDDTVCAVFCSEAI